ncbi:MAG TPA: hypothetical protein VLJ62_14435 [Burkholderiaceae bacterium]|nr:hypothetical protein [Burkholderiaceae bacterium]
MTRRLQPLALAACCAALLLHACANNPPTPDWKLNAQGALERGASAYLEGRTAIAEREFAIARAEIARTGRPDLMARAELMRCAAQTASLAFEPCPAFDALRADAPPAELAYAAYLGGRSTAADLPQLPPHHRAVATPGATDAAAVSALQSMPDPLSRQIGAAVLLETGRANPAVIALAIDNASAQGWRRPLLAWLTLQAQRAQAAGDTAAADAVRRRIALIESSGG